MAQSDCVQTGAGRRNSDCYRQVNCVRKSPQTDHPRKVIAAQPLKNPVLAVLTETLTYQTNLHRAMEWASWHVYRDKPYRVLGGKTNV